MEIQILFAFTCWIWNVAEADCRSRRLTEQFGFFEHHSALDGENCRWTFAPPKEEKSYVFIVKMFQIKHFTSDALVFLPDGTSLKDLPSDQSCMSYISPGGSQDCLKSHNVSGCSKKLLSNTHWPPVLSASSDKQFNSFDPMKVFQFKLSYLFLDCPTRTIQYSGGVNDTIDDVCGSADNLILIVVAAALGFLLLVAVSAIVFLIAKRPKIKPRRHIGNNHRQLVAAPSLPDEPAPSSTGLNLNTYVYVDQASTAPNNECDSSNVYSSISPKQDITNVLYHSQ